MKKLLCVALLVPSVAFASAGKPSASEGYYSRLDLGADLRKGNKVYGQNIKKNKTAVVSVGMGYKFNEYLRSDLNLQFRNLKTELKENDDIKSSAQNKALTAMLNGYVDLPTGTMFTPYAVVGLGMSNIAKADVKFDYVTDNATGKRHTSFAWNAGLGVNTKIQDNLSLDLGYKYVNVGKLKVSINNESKTSKIQAHELTAGVIFSF